MNLLVIWINILFSAMCIFTISDYLQGTDLSPSATIWAVFLGLVATLIFNRVYREN